MAHLFVCMNRFKAVCVEFSFFFLLIKFLNLCFCLATIVLMMIALETLKNVFKCINIGLMRHWILAFFLSIYVYIFWLMFTKTMMMIRYKLWNPWEPEIFVWILYQECEKKVCHPMFLLLFWILKYNQIKEIHNKNTKIIYANINQPFQKLVEIHK